MIHVKMADTKHISPPTRFQLHTNFRSRSATDDAGELSRRDSNMVEHDESPGGTTSTNPYEPTTTPPTHEHNLTTRLFGLASERRSYGGTDNSKTSSNGQRHGYFDTVAGDSLTSQMHANAESKKTNGPSSGPKPGLGPRPIGGVEKLGLFSGVYVPTCLNVLSILMFLRFGFILGQMVILPLDPRSARKLSICLVWMTDLRYSKLRRSA